MEPLRLILVAGIFCACAPPRVASPPSPDMASNDMVSSDQPAPGPLVAPSDVSVVDNADGSVTIRWTPQAGASYDVTTSDDVDEATAAALTGASGAWLGSALVVGDNGVATVSATACEGPQYLVLTAIRSGERRPANAVSVTPTLGPDACWSVAVKNRVFTQLAANPTASVFLARDSRGVLWRSTDQGATFTRLKARRASSGPVFSGGHFHVLESGATSLSSSVDGLTFTVGTTLPVAAGFGIWSNGDALYLSAGTSTVWTTYRLTASNTWAALPAGYNGVTTGGLHIEYNQSLAVRVASGESPAALVSLAPFAGTCDRIDRIVGASDRFYARLSRVDGGACLPFSVTSTDGVTWATVTGVADPYIAMKVAGKYVLESYGTLYTSTDAVTFAPLPAGAGPINGRNWQESVVTTVGAFLLSPSGTLVRTSDGSTYTSVHIDADWRYVLVDGANVIVASAAGELAISRDHGASFARTTLADMQSSLSGLFAFGPGKYVAYGSNGTLYASTDAGATWANRSSPGWGSLTAAAGDASRLFLVSNYADTLSAYILASIDGAGTTFAFDDVSSAPSYCGQSFQLGGVLHCFQGTDDFTSSDGLLWTPKMLPQPLLYVGGDSTRAFAGYNGVYYSTTTGDSWTALTGWPASTFLNNIASAGGKWHALQYPSVVYRSTDLSTWSSKAAAGLSSCATMVGAGSRLVCLSFESIASLPVP